MDLGARAPAAMLARAGMCAWRTPAAACLHEMHPSALVGLPRLSCDRAIQHHDLD